MPLQATSGAASYDAFGGGVPVVPNYIEEVFSTYLYTGNGSTQTITNGIDLAGKGGLTWIKGRSGATAHRLTDTARGVTKSLESNSFAAQATESTGLTAFGTTGFTIGADADYNTNAATYVSWTFRKQPKFFDVVTYTGNDTTLNISHNLGSVPGCIIVKSLIATSQWQTWHRSLTSGNYIRLNLTGAQSSAGAQTAFGNNSITVDPTSTQFTVGSAICGAGENYVAYLFAHDAGGFGLTGTDNVISCGSYTTDVSGNATVNLGWEPQWFLRKKTSGVDNWRIADNMRGWTALGVSGDGSGNQNILFPNLSNAESSGGNIEGITSTGFGCFSLGTGNETFIYIAIRRGPMKVPTLGTSVFSPVARTGTSSATTISAGFTTDLIMDATRGGGFKGFWDRLRGATRSLSPYSTGAEFVDAAALTGFDSMTGVLVGADGANSLINNSSSTYINWMFRRAPSFFDEVCYTGTGSNTTITHNLGAVPELIIVKGRSGATAWESYCSALANTEYLVLNTTAAKATGATRWNSTTPTSSVFSIGTSGTTNTSAATYVAYLFATCAGVSKVFSYTGNGSSQTINCGFTAGSRFVLIKRTDSTGDWYVWDSARGIVAGNDPHLSLNDTAAEVTTDDSVDTDNTGFIVNQVAATNVNVTSATYIGIAIA